MWLALLALLAHGVSAEMKCGKDYPKLQTTFDLSMLTMKGRLNYNVQDIEDTVERNYTYIFNVCSAVGHLPSSSCDAPNNILAPVYQLNEVSLICFLCTFPQ